MKKHLSTILTVISCILVAVCLMRMIDLENRVIRMEQDLSNDIRLLRDSVNGISGSIQNAIQEENNLLSSTACSYRDPDYTSCSVTLEYSVTPKQYDPKQTVLSLITQRGTEPMVLKNGSYTAVFEVPLFESTTIASVQFEENGVITTQQIDEYLLPKEQFVPTVIANYSGSSTISRKSGADSAIKTYQGNVTIAIKQTPEETGIRSVELLEWMDGELFAKTELSLNFEDAWEASGLERPTESVDALFPANYSHSLKGYKVEIPYGSSYEMTAVVTDENGLTHRVILDREKIDENGEPQKLQEDWYNTDASIYGPDGECLYKTEYEVIG